MTAMAAAMRRALEGLVGRGVALDVRLPEPKPVAMPKDQAEAAALAEVHRCMGDLQRAVENYEAVTGRWRGRPKIAVGFGV